MQIKDEFYIATSDDDFYWAIEKLQNDGRVDWRSIRHPVTINGCTPIWWKLKEDSK